MKIVDKIWNFTLQETITRGRRTINRPPLHYLLLLYHNIFLLLSILYDFFGIIFNFSPLSEGTLCRPKVPFHPPRALARLRRSNSCFKQKGNFLTFPLPNYSTYPRYSLLSSFSLLRVYSAWALVYHFR